jgi:integrase
MLGIIEPLTSYVFRYTYANVAKKLGFSKDMIAEALGHEYGNNITGIYLEEYDNKVLDGMNETIISCVTKVKGELL